MYNEYAIFPTPSHCNFAFYPSGKIDPPPPLNLSPSMPGPILRHCTHSPRVKGHFSDSIRGFLLHPNRKVKGFLPNGCAAVLFFTVYLSVFFREKLDKVTSCG